MYLKYLLSSYSCCYEWRGAAQTDWRAWFCLSGFGGRSLSQVQILLEAKWVTLQCCSVMKEGNILFHPLIYFIFGVK